MQRGRPKVVGDDKVAIRVLLPRKDYEDLGKIAALERTDIAALVRRAVAFYFLIPNSTNLQKRKA